MKTAIKTSALIILTAMTAQSMAATTGDDASGIFQWAGQLPAANVGTNITIVDVGTIPHQQGVVVFADDGAGNFTINSTSELAFNVEDSAGTVHAAGYEYELDSVKYSVAGSFLSEDLTGLFKVDADGAPLTANTAVQNASSDPVRLTLSNGSAPLNAANGFEEGSEVIVQGTILVTAL